MGYCHYNRFKLRGHKSHSFCVHWRNLMFHGLVAHCIIFCLRSSAWERSCAHSSGRDERDYNNLICPVLLRRPSFDALISIQWAINCRDHRNDRRNRVWGRRSDFNDSVGLHCLQFLALGLQNCSYMPTTSRRGLAEPGGDDCWPHDRVSRARIHL